MKVNLKLLKRLYLIDHESGKEHDMISFILNYCYKIPHLTFSTDSERNLFITKNTTNPDNYACVVAHMDTAQSFSSARELVIRNNIITARYINTKNQCGLNADDCNGILVALQLLETLPNLKICFTTNEEAGADGAFKAAENVEFFINVRYLIQADRRGNSDLIVHTNGINSASKKFVEDIQDIMYAYGYSENTGTFTDIGVLANILRISGVNVSCGYTAEHAHLESCNITDLNKCLNFIYDIITALDDNETYYTIEEQNPFKSANSANNDPYYGIEYYNYYNDSPSDYTLPCDNCSDQDCMHCKHVF